MSLSFANEQFSFAFSLTLFRKSLFGNQANRVLLPWEIVRNPATTNSSRMHHSTCASKFFPTFPPLSFFPLPTSPAAPHLDCGDHYTYIWEYTKNHETEHFTWMNWLVFELYLNKSVIFFLKSVSSSVWFFTEVFLMNEFKINLKWVILLWYAS